MRSGLPTLAKFVRSNSLGSFHIMSLVIRSSQKRTRTAILNFKKRLPFQYEEHRNLPASRKFLADQALRYAEHADPENYRVYKTEIPDQVAIRPSEPVCLAT